MSVVGTALEIAFPATCRASATRLDRRQRGLIDQLVRSSNVWLLDDASFDRFTTLVAAYRLGPGRTAIADYVAAP